ncbi:MAG: hypothetical protein NXI27_12175 [Alphaproteobacteria bacterium]|nr:hypothetical protein [Alphaproteobacteria bacterium]
MSVTDAGLSPASDVSHGGRWWDIATLCVAITTSYLLLNWQFIGPTYLSDEIGYLSSAAFFAGRHIDGATSYHFGYSLFLVPSYLLFSDPAVIWKSVLVTNALIFSAAFSVLYLIGETFCANRLLRFFLVLMTAAYPAYPIMSGYSFSQPAFVFVFLLCCLAVLRFSMTSYSGQLLTGGLVGFLYWIHPTALAVAAGLAVVEIIVVLHDRRALGPVLLGLIVAGLMIVLYKMVLHPSVMLAMTPDGFAPRSHYPTISNRLLTLLHPSGLLEFVTRLLGQASYVIISTLSIAMAGVYAIVMRVKADLKRGSMENVNLSFHVFLLFSFLFLVCMVSAFFGNGHGSALNNWFYGRYLEGVLAPLLFVSLLSRMDRRANILVSSCIIISFIVLFSLSGFTNTWLNMINVSGFWPALISRVEGVPWWFAIGAAGSAIAVLMPRPVQMVALLISFGVCIHAQIDWHHGSFRTTSTPTGLQTFVRDYQAPGSCIGLGSRPKDRRYQLGRERFKLYSYYLHDYRYQRMSPSDWFADCDGFYLTFHDAEVLSSLGAVQVAMETKTGLRVYAKQWPQPFEAKPYGTFFLQHQPGEVEDRAVYHMAPDDLSPFVQAGRLSGDRLVATGSEGFLFYGPYILVRPGTFAFEVFGIADNVSGAWIDIVSSGGGTIHAKFPLQSTSGEEGLLAKGKIVLPSIVSDLEIRLWVEAANDIQVLGYEVTMPK